MAALDASAIGKTSVHAAADIHRPAVIGRNSRHARHRTITLVQVLEFQRNSVDEKLGNKT
jgi:hypothetical protein